MERSYPIVAGTWQCACDLRAASILLRSLWDLAAALPNFHPNGTYLPHGEVESISRRARLERTAEGQQRGGPPVPANLRAIGSGRPAVRGRDRDQPAPRQPADRPAAAVVRVAAPRLFERVPPARPSDLAGRHSPARRPRPRLLARRGVRAVQVLPRLPPGQRLPARGGGAAERAGARRVRRVAPGLPSGRPRAVQRRRARAPRRGRGRARRGDRTDARGAAHELPTAGAVRAARAAVHLRPEAPDALPAPRAGRRRSPAARQHDRVRALPPRARQRQAARERPRLPARLARRPVALPRGRAPLVPGAG